MTDNGMLRNPRDFKISCRNGEYFGSFFVDFKFNRFQGDRWENFHKLDRLLSGKCKIVIEDEDMVDVYDQVKLSMRPDNVKQHRDTLGDEIYLTFTSTYKR